MSQRSLFLPDLKDVPFGDPRLNVYPTQLEEYQVFDTDDPSDRYVSVVCVCVFVCVQARPVTSPKQFTCFYWKISKSTVSA